jgi:hypothetical protein
MEKTLNVLNRLVADGVIEKYAIGGAMGAMFYTEPVSTYDLDVFAVIPALPSGLLTLTPLYQHLSHIGYEAEGECVMIEGTPVQFLPAYNPLVAEALENSVILDYGAIKVPVLSAEYLVVISIQTGRAKDKIRVRMMLDEAELNMGKLFDILDRHKLVEKGRLWMQ